MVTPGKDLFPSLSQRRRLGPLFFRLRLLNARQSVQLADDELWCLAWAMTTHQKVAGSTKE